jgi:hypothetical protein
MGDPIKDLFDSYNSKYQFAKDFNEFKAVMSDPNNRKAFFDEFNGELGLAKDFDEFESVFSVKKKEPFGIPSVEDPKKLPAQSGGSTNSSSPSKSVSPSAPRLTYTDIDKILEKVNKLQKGVDQYQGIINRQKVYDARGVKGVAEEYRAFNPNPEAKLKPLQEQLTVALKEKDQMLKEYSKDISKPVDKIINNPEELKKFFEVTDEGIVFKKDVANKYIGAVIAKYGGGTYLHDQMVADIKSRGTAKMQEPALNKFIADGMQKVFSEDKVLLQQIKDGKNPMEAIASRYGKEVFEKIAAPILRDWESYRGELTAARDKSLSFATESATKLGTEFNNFVTGLNEQIKSGQLTPDQAKATYEQQKVAYEKEIANLKDEYIRKTRELQIKANKKYGRIEGEIKKIQSSLTSEDIFKALPANVNMKLKSVLHNAYTKLHASENAKRKLGDLGTMIKFGVPGLFVKSIYSGLNTGLANLGDALLMNKIDNSFSRWLQERSTEGERYATGQWEWNGSEFALRAITGTGQSLGQSLPSMAIAIPATALGGAGGVVAGGIISNQLEGASIAGERYRQTLEQTGDVNKAYSQAKELYKKNNQLLPLYFIGSLGDKMLLKSSGLARIGIGAGLEMAEEIPVEYLQEFNKAQQDGYTKSFSTFVKENPEIGVDTAIATLGQGGVIGGIGKVFTLFSKNVSSSNSQAIVDAIKAQGPEFAQQIAKTQFETGVITEKEYRTQLQEIQRISVSLGKLNESGVTGDAAQMSIALADKIKDLEFKIQAEKDPAVKATLQSQLSQAQSDLKGVADGSVPVISFNMPGGVGSTRVMTETEFQTFFKEAQDELIRNADGISSTDPRVSQLLGERKKMIGNENQEISSQGQLSPEALADMHERKSEVESILNSNTETGELSNSERLDLESELEHINTRLQEQDNFIEETADPLTIGGLVDKKVRFNKGTGTVIQDGQTLVIKMDGQNKEYELGSIRQVAKMTPEQFGIKIEDSLVEVDKEGNFAVQGKIHRNPLGLDAIKRKEGRVQSVTLMTAAGKRRKFQGQIAEDLAYQITLHEITNNESTANEFERHLETEEEVTSHGEVLTTGQGQANGNNGEVLREKAQPVQITYDDAILSFTPEEKQRFLDLITEGNDQEADAMVNSKMAGLSIDPKFSNFDLNNLKSSLVKNAVTEVDRIKSLDESAEDGATMNLDGSKYTEGGLVVPVTSMNTTQEAITPEMIADFVAANQGKLSEGVKVGIYKFPDSNVMSIDLNIVVPNEQRSNALEFARLAGQESLFDLDSFENVKTGATGGNPKQFTDDQFAQIGDDLVKGKMPEVFDEIDQLIANINKAYGGTGVTAFELSEEEFNKKAGQESGVEGLFMDDGHIYYNKAKLRSSGFATRIVLHEGAHPVMNILYNTDRALYNQVVSGMREAAEQDANIAKAVQWAENNYKGDEVQDNEAIVETIASIGDGTVAIEDLNTGFKQVLIDLINKIAKALGFDQVLDDTNVAAFKKLASKIADTLKAGESVSSIVGEENVSRFENNIGESQFRKETLESPVNFENAKKFASDATGINNKIEFKNKLQEQLEKYLPTLKQVYGKKFNPTVYNELTKQYMSDALTYEAVEAIKAHPEAIGWYDEKTQASLAVMALVHPEIMTDPEAKGAFILGLAVLSNGNKVDKNFELAEQQYNHYKNTGRFDAEGNFGLQQDGIRKSLVFINTLLDAGISMTELNDFYTSKHRAGDLKYRTPDGKLNSLVMGELADEQVYGAVLLGPKIGNGFYMNLWGEFGQLTMDRWFMRTWGRLTGTLIDTDKDLQKNAKENVKNSIKDIKANKEASDILKQLIPDAYKLKVDDLARAVEKVSMKVDKRKLLSSNPLTDKLRRSGNLLSKYLSGEKEAPANGAERKFIREVFNDVQARLQGEHGIEISMADLQAVLWYPEKILYESFKDNKTFAGASSKYTEDSAPDYLNAAKKLAHKLGKDNEQIRNAARSRGKLDGQPYRRGTEGSGQTVSGENKVLQKIREASGGSPTLQRSVGNRNLIEEAGKSRQMTEDGEGNYIFYHYSDKKIGRIDPRKFGSNLATGRDERPGVGLSMYYTRPDVRESQIPASFGYIVRVPKDQVYPFNEDPLDLLPEAEAEFRKQYPDIAFDFNKQLGFITKIAAARGYKMTVAEWGIKGNKFLRAQTTEALPAEMFKRDINGRTQWDEEISSYKANALKRKPKAQLRVEAYHGSPHDFDHFTTEKIGTGEGFQAFGWGLYFTDLKSIAETYASKLGKPQLTVNGVPFRNMLEDAQQFPVSKQKVLWTYDHILKHAFRAGHEIKDYKTLKAYIDSDEFFEMTEMSLMKFQFNSNIGSRDGFWNYTSDILELAKQHKTKLKVVARKNLYEVVLHKDKEEDWLIWDKAPSESQVEKIIGQAKVEGIDLDYANGEWSDSKTRSTKALKMSIRDGKTLYNMLAKKLGGQKEASLFLLRARVDGVKYPAESIARGATSDTARGFNYVVFDEAAVSVEKKMQLSIGNRLAPNGEPSKLTEEEWNTVRTPEFKQWFGDWENDPKNASKVVDENGEPLVVYQGNNEDFDTYDRSLIGKRSGLNDRYFTFTSNPRLAAVYGNVKPFFLNIRELPEYNNEGKYYDELRVYAGYKWIGPHQLQEFHEKGFKDFGADFNQVDGFKIKNTIELSAFVKDYDRDQRLVGDTFYVYNPNQIKSTTNKTFNPELANTQFSRGNRNDIETRLNNLLAKNLITPEEHAAQMAKLEVKPTADQTDMFEDGQGPERDRGLAKRFGNLDVDTHSKLEADAETYFQRTNQQTEAAVLDFMQGKDLEDLADYVVSPNSLPQVSQVWMAAEVARQLGDIINQSSDQAEIDRLSTKRAAIYNEFSHRATDLGQAVQAFVAFGRDPGAIEFWFNKIMRGLRAKGAEVNDSQKQEIRRLLTEMSQAPTGLPKDKAIIALSHYIAKIAPVSTLDILTALWYAKILSGPTTHVKNTVANFLNSVIEVPLTALRVSLQTGSLMPFFYAAKGLAGGIEKGAVAGYDILKTGVVGMETGKFFDNHNILESFSWKQKVGSVFGTILDYNPGTAPRLWKMVGRSLTAADAVFSTANREAMANMLAYQQAVKEGKTFISGGNYKRVQELLGNSKTVIADAKAQALREGFKKGTSTYIRRAVEIINQERDPALMKDAEEFGKRVTLTNEPQGFSRPIYQIATHMQKALPVSRFLIPFTRVVANMTEMFLNYTPAGLYRAISGQKNPWEKNSGKLSAEERADLALRFTMGVAVLTILSQHTGEDEDDWFELSAGGPRDKDKKYELMKGGWRPYTITFKDGTKVNYQDWPIAPMIAAVGTIRDAFKYDKYDEETFLDSAKLGAYGFATAIYDKSLMKGINDFVELFKPSQPSNTSSGSQRLVAWAAGQMEAVSFSNLSQQIWSLIKESNGDPIKEAKGLEVLYRDLPVISDELNPIIDVFGDPVLPSTSERIVPYYSVPEERKDLVVKYLNELGVYVGIASERPIINFEEETERKMTRDELYQYRKLAGQKTKEYLIEYLEEMKEIMNDEATDKASKREIMQKLVNRITKGAREEALEELFYVD